MPVAALLFLFTVIALLGLTVDQPAVKNLMSFYLQHPFTGLLAGVALVYQPRLLDILPLYILFMLISPWILAQFGTTLALYDLIVRNTGLPVPFNETGAFDTMAWQLVWMLGLWMGCSTVVAPQAMPPQARFPGWLVGVALCITLVTLVWRHVAGQVPTVHHPDINLLFDKWLLGPLRLINLLALIVVTVRFGPWLAQRLPRLHALEAMGRSSLPVFCAHLAAVLVVLALFGDPLRPWWEDAAVVLISA